MAERGRPRSFDRAAALRQAMEVFWAKGYDGASLSDLTAAMGINSPSLYAAFGSKEALFREAVALFETEGTEIWSAIPEEPTAYAAFERFLVASAKVYTRPGQPAGCLIVLSALNATDANVNICQELRDKRAANVATLRDRLERAVREGELPEGMDCLAAASFYATVQQGMSIQARDGASYETLRSVAACAMAAWDGLTAAAQGADGIRQRAHTS
ncbi:TetR/AcrR family transcriptional regulator [Chelativorans salis]|uniref:TetR/AcrR family transcriptional regulator n=1 Tax=Chelativorans salis TaxID=2978478 RepID=A0ABT2LRL3_9HYPH|nr:TetR/AcrR family transcriptional regulator [Chelativorans sp. EGI FJ00035]MCT7377147.1 TetR/AcrR family transcriptional regulator [Chelativorans sp. EGI FJ00035]